ncbi:MAG: hypothetical protein M1358_21970, partial [Chloroflexi bacterium]|nr:hypothetical protein [Chloroflexota bacterium]
MGTALSKTQREAFLHQLIDFESLKRIRNKIELSTGLPLQFRFLTGQLYTDLCPPLNCCELIMSSKKGSSYCH